VRAVPGEAVITIADLGEFGLIAAIAAVLPSDAGFPADILRAAGRGQTGGPRRTGDQRPAGDPGLIIGIGDDAAVVGTPDGRVVAATDLLIEGRHFRRDWSSAADIGGKAAARNLIDVAAMGARPTAILVGLAAPGDLPLDWALDLFRGMALECSIAGARIAGGDTSGAEQVMLAVTALGDLAGQAPVTRSGARPGDMLAIAGTLGSAAAGLALLTAGLAPADPPAGDPPAGDPAAAELAGLVRAHRKPDPPYAAGPQAAALGATSMIDISDGLVADLGHLAKASSVRIDVRSGQIASESVARATALLAAAKLLGTDHRQWLLAGGDDHALAATFPAQTVLPEPWTVIGTVKDGAGVTVDGRGWTARGGWEHFRANG
jgi:thiamine-monophosphate kinase